MVLLSSTTIRFESELRHDHFPSVTLYAGVKLGIGNFAAPPDDSHHRSGPGPSPGRRLEAVREASHGDVFLVPQFPGPLIRDARLQRITWRKSCDGAVNWIVGAEASGEAEVDI